jgi:amidophosphoribosyltransferase
MCGILGAVAHTPVNQLLYDGLLLLQHRGQDAAGIVTSEGPVFHTYKGPGYVRDVFRTRNMRELQGTTGIAHCRYPTAGSAYSDLESQPFYVNSPFGLSLGHNGNLTNSEALKRELWELDFRHVNTNSDSEVLLNVLALELERAAQHHRLDPDAIFRAVAGVHRRCRGAYAVVAMIAGYGMLAFRDPFGIRPLIIGVSQAMGFKPDLGLDRHLMDRAAKATKPASGLDTVDDQMKAMQAVPYTDQAQGLDEFLLDPKKAIQELQDLHAWWRAGEAPCACVRPPCECMPSATWSWSWLWLWPCSRPRRPVNSATPIKTTNAPEITPSHG